uniref:Putative secreted protein n=1 Tax=Anopheles darlingi TaxID=43151 RepID=A0A2M4DM09_ANODA
MASAWLSMLVVNFFVSFHFSVFANLPLFRHFLFAFRVRTRSTRSPIRFRSLSVFGAAGKGERKERFPGKPSPIRGGFYLSSDK